MGPTMKAKQMLKLGLLTNEPQIDVVWNQFISVGDDYCIRLSAKLYISYLVSLKIYQRINFSDWGSHGFSHSMQASEKPEHCWAMDWADQESEFNSWQSKRFLSSWLYPDRCGAHPASCPVRAGAFSPGVKAAGAWSWPLTHMLS
jgi:hypothetical protein